MLVQNDFIFYVKANAPDARALMEYLRNRLADEEVIGEGVVFAIKDDFHFLVNPDCPSDRHGVFVVLRYDYNGTSGNHREEFRVTFKTWLGKSLKDDPENGVTDIKTFASSDYVGAPAKRAH